MRELVLEDDPILRKRAVPFDFDNPQEDPEKLTEELMDAMELYKGMGLSACQIGVDLKVFVMRYNGGALAISVQDLINQINDWNQGYGWNYGAELTINTPLGPIRMYYAIPLSDPKKNIINLGVPFAF